MRQTFPIWPGHGPPPFTSRGPHTRVRSWKHLGNLVGTASEGLWGLPTPVATSPRPREAQRGGRQGAPSSPGPARGAGRRREGTAAEEREERSERAAAAARSPGAGARAGAGAEPGAGRGRGRAGGERRGSAPGERGGRSKGSAGSRPPPPPRRPPARNSSPKVQPGRPARAGGRGAGSRPGTRRRGPARTVPAGGGGGMGTRQTKGSLAERASPGAAPGPRRERPDFWASLLLRAGDKAGRAGAGAGLPPYHRRVGMVQELLRMVRQGRREEAGTLLQHLRQVSAGRGRGGRAGPGAPRPFSRRPGSAEGHRPGPPFARMQPGLAAGALALWLNWRASGQGGGRLAG